MCRRSVKHWFHWWAWTYNPKNIGTEVPAHLPFDLFPRQLELLDFFEARLAASEDGLIEKSRDIGFTWLAGGLALHRWRFHPGFKTTFGSRVEDLVDKSGDPDCIFEKIRMMMRSQPWWMLPEGFKESKHSSHMKLINPDNTCTITGDAGDSMGRGGRSTMYVVDEGAHIQHGNTVDAAISANTDVAIWASSVNGPGNRFYTKRHDGSLRPDQIFKFHYTDDPRKTPEWAEKKRRTMEAHVWAQEYDIDYHASVEGVCIPAKWVWAAQKLTTMVKPEPAVKGVAGLDVGGGGKGKSVFAPRLGNYVLTPTSWSDGNTTMTAEKALDLAEAVHIRRDDGWDCAIKEVLFDSVGVGVGVLSSLANNSRGMICRAINVGLPPSTRMWPDKMTSVEKFQNLKAEIWWMVRELCKASWEKVEFLEGREGGIDHPLSDVILLPPDSCGPDAQALASQLALPKWFRNEKNKIIMESKQQLAARGIASPDHAEALVLSYARSKSLSAWEKLGA